MYFLENQTDKEINKVKDLIESPELLAEDMFSSVNKNDLRKIDNEFDKLLGMLNDDYDYIGSKSDRKKILSNITKICNRLFNINMNLSLVDAGGRSDKFQFQTGAYTLVKFEAMWELRAELNKVIMEKRNCYTFHDFK